MKFLRPSQSQVSHIFTIAVLVLAFYLLYQYFVTGIYQWHIARAGNQVSIGYILSIITGSYLLRTIRIKIHILTGLILLYCILTGTLGAFLLVIYYSASIYMLGIKYYKSGLAIQLSYGVIFFILLRSILSILPGTLFLNEIIFISIVTTYCFVEIPSVQELASTIKRKISRNEYNIMFLVASLVSVGLNIATEKYDHDSMWYPLRSNALYFYKNFFADNAFYGQVHYYPKLWESLTNNIFIEYNYSYGASLTASLYVVTAVIVYNLFKNNREINTLIVITTPVVLGLSFTLKTDFLLLAVFLIAFLGVEKRRYDIVISAILLSLCIKNSAILFILAILFYLYQKNRERILCNKETKKNNFVVLFLSFVVFALFAARTYQLTGVLIASPSPLVGLQEMLGFDYRLPAREPRNTYVGILEIYKMILQPETLGHHRFFYNGFLWAAAVFFIDVFIVILLLLIFVVMYSVPSLGDGNYYAVLTVLLTILFLRKFHVGKVGYVIIVTNIIIAIVANPNWSVPKIPSAEHVCNTIICSSDDRLSKLSSSHKMSGLKEIINDKEKNYFVVSKDKKHKQILWQLFYKYNVTHIRDFIVWNKGVPMYALQKYLDNHIDVLIIENDYIFKGNLYEFELIKIDNNYTYYSRKYYVDLGVNKFIHK